MNATVTPIGSRPRYGDLSQLIHWVTAVLVLVAFVYGPGGSELRVYSHARDFDRQLHETLGLTVFALVVLRVVWRRFDARPPAAAVSRWMRLAATATQAAIYALLFAVPLTAIAGAWLEGHALTLLGGVEIQPLLAKAHATGASLATLHTWLGDALLWLAGLHAAAGLYHHVALRDGVLVSMLPRWFPVRQRRPV
jgi:cytochrome b561